jgi:serine/threonine protein kinase
MSISHSNTLSKETEKKLQSILKDTPDFQFDLLEHIGTGSYGEVFKAKIIETGQHAAVKVIRLEVGEELDDVLNEVNFLKSCAHKNVVAYHGCFMKRGNVKGQKYISIAMEYCGGGSVEGCYKALKGPLNEDEICSIIKESLSGLNFLHSCRKLHRDIKCGNILLTESGDVKLADFGVSTQITKTLSKRHTFIGTPYWMAPEVITSEQCGTEYDYKADIWSLGITAIEMTQCSPPMFDMHPMRVLFMIPNLDPPKLTQGTWTPEFHDFIAKCLQKDPDNRPTAEELLNHPFVKKANKVQETIINLIQRSREARRNNKGNDLDDDEEAESDNDNESHASESIILNPAESNPTSPTDKIIEPISNDNSKKIKFDTTRVCRVNIPITCADFYEDLLLFGTENGLYSYPLNEPGGKLRLLSTRKYLQLNVIEEIGTIVSRSGNSPNLINGWTGKYDVVSIHNLKSIANLKKPKKFETETKIKKLKETKGCYYYSITKIGNSVYLSVAKTTSILIMKYAPQPFNKFMKLKEINIDTHVTHMEVIEFDSKELQLCITSNTGFQIINLTSVTCENINFDSIDITGPSLRSVLFSDKIFYGYKNMAIVAPIEEVNKKIDTIKWKEPITYIEKFGNSHIVTGSACEALVYDSAGNIVHIFETKQNTDKKLNLLVSKNDQLYLSFTAQSKDEKGAISTISTVLRVRLQALSE